MNAKDLERFLVEHTSWSPTEIDQRARNLRVSRMFPTGGGRGVNAPDVDSSHAAAALIALGVSDKAVDAVQSVVTYGPLLSVYRGFFGRETFKGALELILESFDGKLCVDEVVICRSWPMAKIVCKKTDGGIDAFIYGYDTADKAIAAGFKTYTVRVETRFGGGFLSELARKLCINLPPDLQEDHADVGEIIVDYDKL